MASPLSNPTPTQPTQTENEIEAKQDIHEFPIVYIDDSKEFYEALVNLDHPLHPMFLDPCYILWYIERAIDAEKLQIIFGCLGAQEFREAFISKLEYWNSLYDAYYNHDDYLDFEDMYDLKRGIHDFMEEHSIRAHEELEQRKADRLGFGVFLTVNFHANSFFKSDDFFDLLSEYFY